MLADRVSVACCTFFRDSRDFGERGRPVSVYQCISVSVDLLISVSVDLLISVSVDLSVDQRISRFDFEVQRCKLRVIISMMVM